MCSCGWFFYLLALPGSLPHSFHASVTPPASSVESGTVAFKLHTKTQSDSNVAGFL